MKKFVLLIFVSFAQVGLAQSGFGIDPNKPGLGLNPYSGYGSYGLTPEQIANYEQLYKSHAAAYEQALSQEKKRKEQYMKTDSQVQSKLQELNENYMWELQTTECKSRMSALLKLTQGKNGSEFILKKDQLVFVDGEKTYIYSKKGLMVVSGTECKPSRSAKISDGMETVFKSTLPKAKAPKSDISEQDESILNEQFKSHLATLKACKELLSEDFVNTIIKTWHMQSENTSAQPARRDAAPAFR